MTTQLIRFPTGYRVLIGPAIDQVLLLALGERLDGESIPVSLRHDPATPDQRPTIAILLDSRNMRRLLGAEPAGIGNPPQGEPRAWWRLGAIHGDDPNREALSERIDDQDAPLLACLNWERHAWRVRVMTPDPDAEDCDLLF